MQNRRQHTPILSTLSSETVLCSWHEERANPWYSYRYFENPLCNDSSACVICGMFHVVHFAVEGLVVGVTQHGPHFIQK